MSDETRGRRQAVTKGEVMEMLLDKKWHTATEVAEVFDVARSTINKRVKEIAVDGHVVLMGQNGYKLTDVGDITDDDAALAVEKMSMWMIAIVTRQAMTAKPMKRLLTAARKMLPKTMQERQAVRKYLVQLTHMIDFTEIDNDE